VDYVAVGPVFATPSKRNHDPLLGVEGLRAVRSAVARPLVAIGGITLETAPTILRTGVDAVAVISALRTGEDLEEVARTWLSVLNKQGGGPFSRRHEEKT
jgi:thiamine-phosphate pyrophosphorylase